MVIIGLSPMVHESAVGIVVDNRLVAAAAEERFTRVNRRVKIFQIRWSAKRKNRHRSSPGFSHTSGSA